MNTKTEPPALAESGHWLDQPRNVERLWRGFLVVLALTVLAELVVQLHPHFEIESVFGFSAWFGFMTCTAMIGVAKALALVLKRPDTYYGKRDD
ncbi:MAG: hypothetical protein IPG93_02960 [Burkholderiales bacterium]|nr:hypothetical protein [Burkholderiales bacterium]